VVLVARTYAVSNQNRIILVVLGSLALSITVLDCVGVLSCLTASSQVQTMVDSIKSDWIAVKLLRLRTPGLCKYSKVSLLVVFLNIILEV
jgi:hypothetical protein